MLLALLGLNPQTLALATSAAEQGVRIVSAAEVGAAADQLAALAPGVVLTESWESFLIGDRADVVLVAGPPPERSWTEEESDRLRKLVQEAIPVLVAPPMLDVNFAYELEMFRRERGGLILAPSLDYRHPGLDRLARIIETAGPLGEAEQIVFERHLADRSRPNVLAQFAEDAALLRRILGTIKTVSATGGAATEYRDPMAGGPKPLKPLSSIAVHLTGDTTFGARWFVSPPASGRAATITIEGAQGRAKLELFASRPARFTQTTTEGEEQTELEESSLWPALQNVLRRHERRALGAHAVSHEAGTADEWPSTLFPAWIDVCHDLEAAEAIDRSLVRGRTVNVTTEEASEEESFKGVMAAGGCLTLVCALGLFLLAGLVEALKLPIRNLPIWRFSPLLPLTPIVLFLLLQLFRLAVPTKSTPADG